MIFSTRLLYGDEHHIPLAVVEKNTKLSKQQIESAYNHIHSLKNAARSIQVSPPVYLG